MCLLSFAFRKIPNAPLVVIANRDEFYNRPTQPMHWWQDKPILAGRDLQAGGTWLGLSASGRFAAVTNYRQVSENAQSGNALLSRGNLVADFLCSDLTAMQWVNSTDQRFSRYDGFNLLLYDGRELIYLNNFQDSAPQSLRPGVYGLSNHNLDSPWPKVDYARQQVQEIVARHPALSGDQVTTLLDSLSLQKTYPPDLLPNTGIPQEWEELLSSAFIVAPEYGTRCSTALIVSAQGTINIAERTYSAAQDSQDIAFQI